MGEMPIQSFNLTAELDYGCPADKRYFKKFPTTRIPHCHVGNFRINEDRKTDTRNLNNGRSLLVTPIDSFMDNVIMEKQKGR